jgi:hypothetical protein
VRTPHTHCPFTVCVCVTVACVGVTTRRIVNVVRAGGENEGSKRAVRWDHEGMSEELTMIIEISVHF